MRLLLLAVAIIGAFAQDNYEFQECPSNLPLDLITLGTTEGLNELYNDKDVQPLFELRLFDLEKGYQPFESHTLGIVSNDKLQRFAKFTVTVENRDPMCSPGVLKSTNTRSREIKSCPNVIINNEIAEEVTKVSFRWKAPECGCATIRATVVDPEMDYYYLESLERLQGALTKTICPVGTEQYPDMIDLTDEELETIETVGDMMDLTAEEMELLDEITDVLTGDDMDELDTTDADIEIMEGDMGTVIFNEICAQERQMTSLRDDMPNGDNMYPCCRVRGEERRNCFLTRDHPDSIMERIEDLRLEMICDKMTMTESDDVIFLNPNMRRCCDIERRPQRKQCFTTAKRLHYDSVCRGDEINLFFSVISDWQVPSSDHFCCSEEREERIMCFDGEERRELFPSIGEDVEDEMMEEMDERRLNRVCRRFNSRDDREDGRRRRPHRQEVLSECCQEPKGERRQCILRAKHENIDRVCSGEDMEMSDSMQINREDDDDINELLPRFDRRDKCCEKTGEERYQCFRQMRRQRFRMKFMPPIRMGPMFEMVISGVEDSRVERICRMMLDGNVRESDVKEDLLMCCELASSERTQCFKTAENQHLNKVCNREEVDYLFRLGHFGENVDIEDVDDIVTADNPCCEEPEESRSECFDTMSKMHLWKHRRGQPAMMGPRPWMNPEDRFNDRHREMICRKVSQGLDEEVEMELDNGDIEDEEPRQGGKRWRRVKKNDDLMDAMRQCCMKEGEESRQCMLDTRKVKYDVDCMRMAEDERSRPGMPSWRREFKTAKQECCAEIGDERYQCFDDMPKRKQMKPTPFWRDPENRFCEEHRERICDRIIDDEDVGEVEKEMDEEVATDMDNLAIGMMLKNFRSMLSFFYRKMSRDNDLMDKMTSCCFQDGEESRTCFEEARKMKIDNMCQIVRENEDAEEDSDVMTRPSFWMKGKARCCSMEGDERYNCFDEMRRPDWMGMRPHGMRPHGMRPYGMGPDDMGRPGPGRPSRPGYGRPNRQGIYKPDTPNIDMSRRPGKLLGDHEEYETSRGQGSIDPRKVDDFCDTPVARTAILFGMPKKPGFPPATCCEQEGEDRYRCFRQKLPRMEIAPEFDFTLESEERRDHYKSSDEDKENTREPAWVVDEMKQVYDSSESSESNESEEDGPDDRRKCCRVGHAAGSEIENFRYVQCEAKSFKLAKEREISRMCRRAFVRCCVGRRDEETPEE